MTCSYVGVDVGVGVGAGAGHRSQVFASMHSLSPLAPAAPLPPYPTTPPRQDELDIEGMHGLKDDSGWKNIYGTFERHVWVTCDMHCMYLL